MNCDARLLLTNWILMAVLFMLLWYRNSGFDRVYSIYALIIGLVLLLLYGVQSGADPRTSAKLGHSIIWIGIILLLTMVYVMTATTYSAIVLIAMVLVALAILYIIYTDDCLIDITGHLSNPPQWVNGRLKAYLPILILLGFILPLFLIGVYTKFQNLMIFVWIILYIVAMWYCLTNYGERASLSVWFYLLSFLVLLMWIANLYM